MYVSVSGDLLRGTITCCKNKSYHRSLDIKLNIKLLPLLQQKGSLLNERVLTVEQWYCLS